MAIVELREREGVQLALLAEPRRCGTCRTSFDAAIHTSCPECLGARESRPGVADGLGWAAEFVLRGCRYCGGAQSKDGDDILRCFNCGRTARAPVIAADLKRDSRRWARARRRAAAPGPGPGPGRS
jgi:hypothetical protein